MPIELIHPGTLPQSEIYHQVAVATGSRTVYLAGQVARTATGEPVGAGDLAARAARKQLVGGTTTHMSDVLAFLQDAARTGRQVWIGYVDNHGTSTERIVDPVRVEGGHPDQRDRRDDEVLPQ